MVGVAVGFGVGMVTEVDAKVMALGLVTGSILYV